MSQKNGILWENGLPSNSYKIQKLGVFWKIYDIGYTMGIKIFKIEEEMTEKMKPKFAKFFVPLAWYVKSDSSALKNG